MAFLVKPNIKFFLRKIFANIIRILNIKIKKNNNYKIIINDQIKPKTCVFWLVLITLEILWILLKNHYLLAIYIRVSMFNSFLEWIEIRTKVFKTNYVVSVVRSKLVVVILI